MGENIKRIAIEIQAPQKYISCYPNRNTTPLKTFFKGEYYTGNCFNSIYCRM